MQITNGQRKPARWQRLTAARQPGLPDETRAIHRLGIRQKKTKRFLHVYPQCF
ncbi:MAG: hypothetical protein P4L92_10580 [Rudaea sp.]|nr:hypothetical protein [Rudaea sp.]